MEQLRFQHKKSESLALFKKRILVFIRPAAYSAFHCHNANSLKLIASLRSIL